MECVFSVAVSIRVVIWYRAKQTAPISGMAEAHCQRPLPGRTIIHTPINPAITASQRCVLIRSPNSGIASPVINNGAMKPIAVASASGKNVSPTNRDMIEPARKPPRIH